MERAVDSLLSPIFLYFNLFESFLYEIRSDANDVEMWRLAAIGTDFSQVELHQGWLIRCHHLWQIELNLCIENISNISSRRIPTNASRHTKNV